MIYVSAFSLSSGQGRRINEVVDMYRTHILIASAFSDKSENICTRGERGRRKKLKLKKYLVRDALF